MATSTYIGKLIDNRYQINGRVGSGGSARVYRAHDTLMGRTVALKILEADETRYRINSRSFETEVEAISKLSHPNVVTIYDVSMQGNVNYIVMEFVDGITLREYLNFHTHLVPEEVFSCARQILAALDAAHAKGIIHRDIKPQNVMILKNGQVKVADFGIARLPDTDNFKLDDRAIGTVHYISPEQATGSAVDARSDLYSLGILMYEMLTGSRPFEASDASTVAMMQVSDTPAAPHTLRDDIPPALEQVIMRAMSKEPDDRYENAAAMLRALARAEKHPNGIFRDASSGKASENEKNIGGFFGKLFGRKHTAIEDAVTIDGVEDEAVPEQEENKFENENDQMEDEDMKVILDRDRYESKRKKWGTPAAFEEESVAEAAPEEAEVLSDDVSEVSERIEDISEDTVEEDINEDPEASESLTEVTDEEIEELDELEELDKLEETEEIEELEEEFKEEIEEEIEELEEDVEEPEAIEEAIEEAEKTAEEEEDGLDVPEFLRSRIEATVAKEQEAAFEPEEEAESVDTADTVLFNAVTSESVPEDAEEEYTAEEDVVEDVQDEALSFAEEVENARMAELDEMQTVLDEKQAALDEQIAEYELLNARLDTRAAEADARDASLDKKEAFLNAKEAEADARFAEADARFAAAEARVQEADARFAELEAMREAEMQEPAAGGSDKGAFLLKLLFPIVSGALTIGLLITLWYSGILLGRYVPDVDVYRGEEKIKGMNVVVEYVRDDSAYGTVLAQTPAAGFTRKDTDTVYLRVSAGKSVYEKYKDSLDKELTGDLDSALNYLNFINTNNPKNPQNRAVKIYETSDTVKAGEVIRYEIDPMVDQDGVTTIYLYVSIGADE